MNLLHKKIRKEQGISLVVVLLILAMVSMLGVASIQISKSATQSARNEQIGRAHV